MSITVGAENAKRIEEEDDDTNVEQFRIKKLIKRLTEAKGYFFFFSFFSFFLFVTLFQYDYTLLIIFISFIY